MACKKQCVVGHEIPNPNLLFVCTKCYIYSPVQYVRRIIKDKYPDIYIYRSLLHLFIYSSMSGKYAMIDDIIVDVIEYIIGIDYWIKMKSEK